MTGNFPYDLSFVLKAFAASLFSLIIFNILIRNKSAKNKHLNLPPGSYGWPVLGESLEFLGGSRAGTPGKFVAENERLNPSRYDGGGPIPYSYVPFGGGPRMCLGKEFARLEILIFLHNLIKIYRWDLVIPGEKIIYDPIPTPVNGLPISLHRNC